MKNEQNDFLLKFTNNKLLLFLVPNLICLYQLFYYYNQNINLVFSVLFYEVIIGCIIYLFINTLIYFLVQKILKNYQKTFIVMCFISIGYWLNFNYMTVLIFLFFMIFLIIDFKFFINFSLDNLIGISSFIIIFLFSFTFFTSIYNISYMTLKSKSYDYQLDIEVDKEKDSPNIYWIHCDGMINFDTLKKYFNTEVNRLEKYFNDNDYYYNDEAQLIAGHKTMRALVALFNPYYYDNFYGDYLMDLEKTLLNKKKKTDFVVDYYELEEKRLNNELFEAFSKKGYDTVAVAEYNSHTAFNTDYYYDYYQYMGIFNDNTDLRFFKRDYNSELKRLAYIRLTHSELLYFNTILKPLIYNVDFLNHDVIDYSDVNLSKYWHTRTTKYWYSRAFFKVIDEHKDDDKAKFMFIDYNLNHYPIAFNRYGDYLKESNRQKLDSYSDNYIYSINLLIELFDYIKNIDEDAVIVVQGDHGIHSFSDDEIMKYFDTNQKGVQEIRNSTISAIYVPEKYADDGDYKYLDNPLNFSRYLVNQFVGENYEYLD